MSNTIHELRNRAIALKDAYIALDESAKILEQNDSYAYQVMCDSIYAAQTKLITEANVLGKRLYYEYNKLKRELRRRKNHSLSTGDWSRNNIDIDKRQFALDCIKRVLDHISDVCSSGARFKCTECSSLFIFRPKNDVCDICGVIGKLIHISRYEYVRAFKRAEAIRREEDETARDSVEDLKALFG